jgi:hypothetical protein
MTVPQATRGGEKAGRLQFGLAALFWLLLIVSVATQQILSSDWTVALRGLLASWFAGWITGLAVGHARSRQMILTASVGGTVGGSWTGSALTDREWRRGKVWN